MRDDHRAQVAAWFAAEERLYPVVLVRPEAYARALDVVRAVVDELSGAGSTEDLVAAFGQARDISTTVAERGGLNIDDLDLDLVAGAAFALRYREVARDVARREAVERISAARERGDRWVIVSESGRPETIPYVRLEMCLPGGEGIRVAADADAETGEPRYSLESFTLEPETGDAAPDQGEGFSRASFDDREAWEQAYRRLRAEAEGSV